MGYGVKTLSRPKVLKYNYYCKSVLCCYSQRHLVASVSDVQVPIAWHYSICYLSVA